MAAMVEAAAAAAVDLGMLEQTLSGVRHFMY
jgi:hypothetical protein